MVADGNFEKKAQVFFAAFAAIQYHYKLPSSGSRILATLPLAVGFVLVSVFGFSVFVF